VGTP